MQTTDTALQHRGRTAYHGGIAAEQAVARHYSEMGYDLLATRWRGTTGEIDLIFGQGSYFIFVEVKKSRSFVHAVSRISRAQKQRIFEAASEFIGTQRSGQLSDMRFDVALVDTIGAIKVLDNVLVND